MSRSNDRLGERAPPSSARRRGSLATRPALGMVLLVFCLTGITVTELTAREWQRLVETKRMAADMVASLFAGTMATALESRDEGALELRLEGLRNNNMIVYAAVFPAEGSNPIAEYRSGHGEGAPAQGAREEGEIQVQSSVHGPTGVRLGSVVVRVSLAQEVQTYRRTQARLLGFGALFAVGLASLLVAIVRRLLGAPLGRLESAAIQLAGGDRTSVPADRDDELGSLSRAFNAMAANIDDRDRRIATQTRRLQALFDNMGQAVMVFGADRLLTEERSRSAERWLDARPGNSIVDTLYPEDESLDAERQAFSAWLDSAFAAPPNKLREVLELAPRAITRQVGGEPMHFDLSFRLAEQPGATRELMLIASDVTVQHQLELASLEKRRELESELAASRRLCSGAGPLLGSFLEMARRRLTRCRELLLACAVPGDAADTAEGRAASARAIDAIDRHLQSIRAESACFDLAQLDAEVQNVESDIGRIRAEGGALRESNAGNISRGLEHVARRLDEAERAFVEPSELGSTILDQVTVPRSKLTRLAHAARGRTDPLARLAEEVAARPLADIFALLPRAVARWTKGSGPRVQLTLDAGGAAIPIELSSVLGAVLSHLLRDAITHADEAEGDRRREQDQRATYNVRISAESGPSGTIIRLEDDCRGLRLAAPVQQELLGVGFSIELLPTSPVGSRLEIAPLPRREGRLRERHVG